MNSTSKTLLILLLITTFFKGIVWAAVVPIWQFPDEQAHFAQVQYYAELKKGLKGGNDLSLEIFESERLLGTLRDERGNNKFTYHPEYQIEYSDSTLGIHESILNNIPFSARTTFVKQEAAGYPPLFYILSSLGYFLGYGSNLFVRVFLTRVFSVLMAVITVWVSYLLGKSLFPKNDLLKISVALFVSFQPMYTFVSSGVNNDNLMNLISTIILWLMVDSLRNGLTFSKSFALGVALGLGVMTKQLLYPFIPLPLLVLAHGFLINKNTTRLSLNKLLIFMLIIIILGVSLFFSLWLKNGRLPSWPSVTASSPGYDLTVTDYLTQKFQKLYQETLPWYWGVFKWLGVVLPLNVIRLIKVVIAFSIVGLVKYLLTLLKNKQFKIIDWQLLLLIFSSVWYAFWLLFWDYMLIRSIGFSHGIQGRNFFPNLAGHMALLLFGLANLSDKWKKKIIKIFGISMIALNILALLVVAKSYYQLYPFSIFIEQASQYKPWFGKGIWIIFWFAIYATFLTQFINKYLSFKEKRR